MSMRVHELLYICVSAAVTVHVCAVGLGSDVKVCVSMLVAPYIWSEVNIFMNLTCVLPLELLI